MIPSDHFVRYYNEVFRELYRLGPEHLKAYWMEIARQQTGKLGVLFKEGGLSACCEYWNQIITEENCAAELELNEDYFELHMKKCSSLCKVMDNDAGQFPLYCDHCMGWVEPLMEHAGLFPVLDIISRTVPECRLRIYKDRNKAEKFLEQALLPSLPYGKGGRVPYD